MLYFCGPNNLFTDNISVKKILDDLEKSSILGLDLETKGRDPHRKKILSLQLSNEENQYVIDVRYIDILKFKNLIESKIIIGHNLKFDYKFLKKAGITLDKIYDTFVNELLIHSGYITAGIKVGYGLDKVVHRYCGAVLDKSTRGEFFNLTSEPFTEVQIEYAAKDVMYLHQVRREQLKILQKLDLEYCSNLENNVVLALADMEYNGLLLDKEAWIKIAIENHNLIRKLEIEMDTILAKELNYPIRLTLFEENRLLDINYASPSQMYTLIKNKLHIHLDNTSDRELEKNKNKHKFIELLLNHRKLAKKISTYGENFTKAINPATGRVHTDFTQIVDTGRIASGKKQKKGDRNPATPNLQNIPRESKYKNCFKAREGYTWISADYSQQELVIMGEAAEDWDFIKTYNDGGDLHCYVGSLMFERTITKEDEELRTQAKTINFGKAYGMGPGKLADTLEISYDKAKELMVKHSKALPKIEKWLNSQGNKALYSKQSRTLAPSKRIRWYPQLKNKSLLSSEELAEIKRKGGNSPVQGTGADITKEALVEIRNLINSYNKQYGNKTAYLLLTVHDQIDVEIQDHLVEDCKIQIKRIMEEQENKYLKVAKMRASVTENKMWDK